MANLFVCAAELFGPGRYTVGVRVCSSKQGFKHLAEFKMPKRLEVQQNIQKSAQRAIRLHFEENPEFCFLVRRKAQSPEL